MDSVNKKENLLRKENFDMKKSLLTVMIAVMIAVVTGCGNKEMPATDETVISAEVSQSADTDSGNTDADAKDTKATAEILKPANKADTPIVSDKDSLDLEEYVFTFEDRSVEKVGEALFDLDDFEFNYENFYLTDTVDIYAYNGACVGYIKSGTSINTIGQNAEWGYISIDDNTRFVKMSDVEAVGFAGTKREYLASLEPKAETPSTQEPASGSVPSAPVVVQPETTVPVEETPAESDKYTPEEAIAVYRSLMEAGGMTWEPLLKDVTSWGTGWIYLEKGDAEEVAASNLESAAMGNGDGNPWTEYYLEVTGSDEEAVYITEWTY